MNTGNVQNDANPDSADARKVSALEAAIARLSATIRWIVILGERDGLLPNDIANLAGVSLELVEAMIARGPALIEKDILIEPGEIS